MHNYALFGQIVPSKCKLYCFDPMMNHVTQVEMNMYSVVVNNEILRGCKLCVRKIVLQLIQQSNIEQLYLNKFS